MKLLCMWDYSDGNIKDKYLTQGKIYETTGKDDCGQYPIIADNGEKVCFQVKNFMDNNDNITVVNNEEMLNKVPHGIKLSWIEYGLNPDRCTCLTCDWETNNCPCKFDLYNTDGDCLNMK